MPDWAQHVRPRLSSLRLPPTRESEIVEELSQHLEDRWRELVASGAHEDEATRLALAEFREGNLLARSMTPLRQAHAPAPLAPGAPAGHVLGDLWQDLRYAVRLYLRQPGFTIAAVLSLALGIGVNTTMFTIVHGVLLRDLPYPEPDRLMRLVQAHSGGEVTMREYEIVKQHARTFEAVAAYRGIGERRLGRAEDQNWITTVAITTDFLRTFGVQPQIGREFTDEETRSGGPSAIILSDEVWRRVFDADPRILGRTIALNDTSATVVGVLPAGFWFPQEVDAALPLRNTGALDDTGTNTSLIARLRSDTTIARAQSELGTMTEQILTVARAHLARDYRGLVALGFRDWVAGDVRENLLLLFGATGVLLLIACGNLALLLLTRSAARARELAVRAALGSSQRRTLAQLLTENLFLAAIGAVVGVVAAHALVRVFVSISPFALPTSAPLTVSGTVLGFTAVTALTTSVLITLVPFLSSRRLNIALSLGAEGKNSGSSSIRARTRHAFIVAEVGLSTTLLVAAGLLVQTLYRTTQQELGFVPDGVVTFETPFAPERSAADRQNFTRLLPERLSQVSGVMGVAATNVLPLTGQRNLPTQRDGHPEHSIGGMEVRPVTAQYFAVMGIPVHRGRAISAADVERNAPVVLVSETVARRWWPAGDAIGDRLTIGVFQGKRMLNDVSREVIGIAGDTKAIRLQAPPRPMLYVPMSDASGTGSISWVVKTDARRDVAAQIRAAVDSVDRGQRITQLRTMEEIVASASATPRFNASLFGIFASVALVLTIVGLYGVLSFLVALRRQEIGTRMALGASAGDVLGAFVRQGLTLTTIGVLLGLVAAWFVARWLTTLLFGVPPHDPASFALVALLVIVVGCAASYVPARRAATIDPLVAMRAE